MFGKNPKALLKKDIYEIVEIASGKPIRCTKKRGTRWRDTSWVLSENVDPGSNIKSTVYNRVGLSCICTTIFRQYTQPFINLLTRQLNQESEWKIAITEKPDRSVNQKYTDGKFMFSSTTFLNSPGLYYRELCLFTSFSNIVDAMSRLNQQRHDFSESCITIKLSRRTHKVKTKNSNLRSTLIIFQHRLGTRLWMGCWLQFCNVVGTKRTSRTRFCIWQYSHTFFHDLNIFDWLLLVSVSKAPLQPCSPFFQSYKLGR